MAARDWVLSFSQRACATPSTAALLLIGSLARETQQSADVDLLYIYKMKPPLDTSDHPLDVDIRAYMAADVVELVKRSQDVISWSLRFGRLVCEIDGFWTALRDAALRDMPLPDPCVAEERAERAAKVYEELLRIGDAEAALEQRITLLTHQAWARILRSGIHPASRPELPDQLRSVGDLRLAEDLALALRLRAEQLRETAMV